MRFKRRESEIIFYYPQHFNRGAGGTNPYFAPMFKVCDENNFSYLIVEEPDKLSGKPSNPKAIKFHFGLVFILLMRKILPLMFFSNFEQRDGFIGAVFNKVSCGAFKSKNYITLSNSMGSFLKGISPNARIFDYQHGIIYSKHLGYFYNRKAPDWIRNTNKEILVFGKGFKDIMIRTDREYYLNRTHCIGAPYSKDNNFVKGKNILVSLQIIESEDVSVEWLNAQVDMLAKVFLDYAKIYQLEGRIVYLKHHPRSNRSFDLSQLFAFPFVRQFDDSIESKKIGLHITFFSTSAFEFASLGIPTLFLFNKIIPEGERIFHNEFEYPYQEWNNIIDWLNAMSGENLEIISCDIKKWYMRFYQPFYGQRFINLIRCANMSEN